MRGWGWEQGEADELDAENSPVRTVCTELQGREVPLQRQEPCPCRGSLPAPIASLTALPKPASHLRMDLEPCL